ncbi:MAG TPA: hypothetical protein VIH28_08375 [Ignavibacteriaceae bacterium]
MNNTIEVPDELEVKFTAKELTDLINYLGTGRFDFVNPVITLINTKIIEAYQSTDPVPIGGAGGAGAPKPKADE